MILRLLLHCLFLSNGFAQSLLLTTPTRHEFILFQNDPEFKKSIRSIESVFNSQDQAYLSQIGLHDIAQTYRIETVTQNPQQFLELTYQIKKHYPRSILDSPTQVSLHNEITPSIPRLQDRWAIKNQGKSQPEYIDDFTTQKIPGIIGEDIHLPEHFYSQIVPQLKPIRVAIIDTGVDTEHPDLKSFITQKTSECEALKSYKTCLAAPGANAKACDDQWLKIDTDNNGYPLDCEGWNFIPKGANRKGTPFVKDDIGHGTHVAGIITQNFAMNAEIVPLKIISESIEDSSIGSAGGVSLQKPMSVIEGVLKAMVYAMKADVQVINLSLGWNGRADSSQVRTIIQKAIDMGITIVASAGNDSTDALVYPCRYPGVICVGSHGPDGKKAVSSNYGAGVDIYAPGLNILSTYPRDLDPYLYTDTKGYDFKDGTSMASPFVAGAAAILRGLGYTAQETAQRIITQARFNEHTSEFNGNLDLTRALQTEAKPWVVTLSKDPAPLLWKTNETTLELPLEFKNIGSSAQNLSIQIELTPAQSQLQFGSLDNTTSFIKISSLLFNQTHQATTSLYLKNYKNLPSDLKLQLTIRNNQGQLIQKIIYPFQISRYISPTEIDPRTLRLPLLQSIGFEKYSLRSIENSDNSSAFDYVAISKTSDTIRYQFLSQKNSNYEVSEIFSQPALAADLMAVQKYKETIAFIYYQAPQGGDQKFPLTIFRFFNRSLKTFTESRYLNDSSVFQLDRVKWAKINGQMTWAWINQGFIPKSETHFDPWSVFKPQDPEIPEIRLYYLDPVTKNSVKTITAPRGYQFVSLLQQSDEDLDAGTLNILLASSDDFLSNYSTALYRNNGFSNIYPLPNTPYRNFKSGVLNTATLLNQNKTIHDWANSFIGASSVGAYRMTALGLQNQNAIRNDLIQQPLQRTEAITNHLASFVDSKQNLSSYTASSYRIFYSDADHSSATPTHSLTTSLNKYSFIPSEYFYFSFWPVVIRRDSVSDFDSGLFIPDGFATYPGSEVITPYLTPEYQTLYKPAYLRFQTHPEYCEPMNRLRPDSHSETHVVYFCTDTQNQSYFLRVPLN